MGMMKSNDSRDTMKMEELSKHYKDAGWTRIVRLISYGNSEWNWINEHDMNVCRIPLKMELWFQKVEDAVAFKLRWI
ncbi:hypothetical protein LCGC14_1280320 [marine sediment metagenome]|uniref:Uncharacterized protein n=1 Tax=marine sediment metagenome TaxID=412755 RepID=A0A0F9LGM9_9ZZZZ